VIPLKQEGVAKPLASHDHGTHHDHGHGHPHDHPHEHRH